MEPREGYWNGGDAEYLIEPRNPADFTVMDGKTGECRPAREGDLLPGAIRLLPSGRVVGQTSPVWRHEQPKPGREEIERLAASNVIVHAALMYHLGGGCDYETALRCMVLELVRQNEVLMTEACRLAHEESPRPIIVERKGESC